VLAAQALGTIAQLASNDGGLRVQRVAYLIANAIGTRTTSMMMMTGQKTLPSTSELKASHKFIS
jgi:hypothetical protein